MKKEDLENGEEYVECDTCGHIVARKRAQIVKVNGGKGCTFGFEYTNCELHKLPYDEVENIWGTNTYWKRMIVEEDGTPIGYKKLPVKKSQ